MTSQGHHIVFAHASYKPVGQGGPAQVVEGLTFNTCGIQKHSGVSSEVVDDFGS